MKIFVSDTYDEMSKLVAKDITEIMQGFTNPVFCPATGETTKGLYKEMVELYSQQKLDVSSWFFVGLDEWMGMNGTTKDSCRYSLDEQLLKPMQVREEHICFFDGKAADPEAECTRIEQFIQQHNIIDIAVVGLGMNGHVGMNEPHTPLFLRSHVSNLDPVTQEVSQKYFEKRQKISQGLTLGLATLLAAKNIFLLVNGTRKAAIVKQVIEGDITEAVPASVLRRHAGLRIYLDKEAASLLSNKA